MSSCRIDFAKIRHKTENDKGKMIKYVKTSKKLVFEEELKHSRRHLTSMVNLCYGMSVCRV